jgi:formylglycine-generating enzyme required for sulfatase activity
MHHYRIVKILTLLLIGSLCDLQLIHAQNPKSEIVNSIGMKLKLIHDGYFTMGGNYLPGDRIGGNPHRVTLTEDYYIGVFEVTQEQYQEVMGENPSHFSPPPSGKLPPGTNSKKHPVENISWHKAVEFCNRLSLLPEERDAGRTYRLPTEAEWEYACRGGSRDAFCFGNDSEQLENYAWFLFNSGDRKVTPDMLNQDNPADKYNAQTHPVGKKLPNAWGLYDMHGNVSEWCFDAPRIFKDDLINPVGSGKEEDHRVVRGGSHVSLMNSCNSAHRWQQDPRRKGRETGLRVAMNVTLPKQEETRVEPRARVPKKQLVAKKDKVNAVTNIKVTPENPSLLSDGSTFIKIRQDIIDAQAKLREYPLSDGPGSRDRLEDSPNLEIAHKDFSLPIIPRTVIYTEGKRFEFSERATLAGEQRYRSDVVYYLVNQVSIPIRITEQAAPQVSLKALKKTLEIKVSNSKYKVYTIRGHGLQFISALVKNLRFYNYNAKTKEWEGEFEMELINNSGAKRIEFTPKQELEVELGKELITIKCVSYDHAKDEAKFQVETKPQQDTITATIGEYGND